MMIKDNKPSNVDEHIKNNSEPNCNEDVELLKTIKLTIEKNKEVIEKNRKIFESKIQKETTEKHIQINVTK